jgi:AcrR family transcriptional regulator
MKRTTVSAPTQAKPAARRARRVGHLDAPPSPAPVTDVTNAPGRPRSKAVDEAILRAALTLFFEHGVEGASIAQIARRAGVAKTSIYRRWPTREALLAQAIEAFRSTMGPSIETVERTPAQDFVALLLEVCGAAARPEARKLMTRLIGSMADLPSLMAVYREIYLMPRRNAIVRALTRMREAGLTTVDADPELLADMLFGAFLHRVLIAGSADDTAEDFRAYMRRLLAQLGLLVP